MQRFIEEGFEVVNAYFEDTYLCEYAKWDRLKVWDYRRDPYTSFLDSKQVIGGETCAWEGSNYSHYLYALYFALPAFGDRVWDIRYVPEDCKSRISLSRAVLGCDIPDGFDLIKLPKCKYLMFRGEPFAEENFEDAIREIWAAIEKYDPSIIGYVWDTANPRIQLEPIGTRGYVELLPIKEI